MGNIGVAISQALKWHDHVTLNLFSLTPESVIVVVSDFADIGLVYTNFVVLRHLCDAYRLIIVNLCAQGGGV